MMALYRYALPKTDLKSGPVSFQEKVFPRDYGYNHILKIEQKQSEKTLAPKLINQIRWVGFFLLLDWVSSWVNEFQVDVYQLATYLQTMKNML